jgi:hypothetical protein
MVRNAHRTQQSLCASIIRAIPGRAVQKDPPAPQAGMPAAPTVSGKEQPSGRELPRQTARRRVLKAGQICFNNRHSTLPCTVRDVSSTGARLAVTGSISAPDTFELHVELDSYWVGCRIVWRRASLLGVEFTTPICNVAATRTQVLSSMTANPRKPSLRAAAR